MADDPLQQHSMPENNAELQEQTPVQKVLEKFKAQSPLVQAGIVGGALFVLILLFSSRGSDPVAPQPVATGEQRETATATTNSVNGGGENGDFETLSPSRPELQQGFFNRQRRELEEMQQAMESALKRKEEELNAIQSSILEQSQRVNQMVESLDNQLSEREASVQRSLEEIRRLAEESRQRGQQAPVIQGGGTLEGGGRALPPRVQGRITQTPLGGISGPGVNPNQALLSPILRGTNNATTRPAIEIKEPKLPPFMPPIGFIRATLLNGFDAIAGGGAATPALVRLAGNYKTAMNSTVNLNGCLMLVEFEGDVSTERALGKPSRMTCVYPDLGAVTYDVTGYVVDEKDGIVGLPGVFYEGDPGRIAAAALADFAVGVADVIESNQSTTTLDSEGTSTSTITGSDTRAQIAGGASAAISTLRDYLAERASRVLPFVRVDNTRELHIVLLSGTELRHEGSPWTLLFDGIRKDAEQGQYEQSLKQAQQQQQAQQVSETQGAR